MLEQPRPFYAAVGGASVAPLTEVDEVMELARKAGVRIVKPGQDAFWGGYHGYFQDPDGHLWEIAWNPNP